MFGDGFKRANQVSHPVETQWHYPILSAAGFVPETLSAVGFVRAYTYKHPDGRVVHCNTGASADYWSGIVAPNHENNSRGYWGTLAKWVKDTATQPPATAL